MSEKDAQTSRESERALKPVHAHMPGFVSDQQIGLGDVVRRVTYAVGIRSCAGCERRAAALNRWMAFRR